MFPQNEGLVNPSYEQLERDKGRLSYTEYAEITKQGIQCTVFNIQFLQMFFHLHVYALALLEMMYVIPISITPETLC